MKKKIKYVFGILFFLLIITFVVLLCFPLVIRTSSCEAMESPREGENRFNPLSKFDFRKGKWRVYLLISPEDLTKLPSGVPRSTQLITGDPIVLEKMKAGWEMELSGGDIATATSEILIFEDDKLVFESGIVLSDKLNGLQNSKLGWATPISVAGFVEPIKFFREIRWPILVL